MAKARARHILVSTKKACEELKTQIDARADFATLAKDHSDCPSGKQGGDWVSSARAKWLRSSMTSCSMLR